jgi:hypothetical protein
MTYITEGMQNALMNATAGAQLARRPKLKRTEHLPTIEKSTRQAKSTVGWRDGKEQEFSEESEKSEGSGGSEESEEDEERDTDMAGPSSLHKEAELESQSF